MILARAVAVVTGASRGLGSAIAEMLRAEGAVVETPSRDLMDVRDGEQVRRCMADIIARHGRIDLLVNNAGWVEPLGTLEDVTEEMFDRCIDTNLKGVFHCMQAVLPVMKEQGGGTIVNVCSRAGSNAHQRLPVYSASKFAVRGLTHAVARACMEEGSGITVFTLSPGGVDTDMRAALFGEEDSARQQKPSDVARILIQCLTGEVDVPHGADVQVVRGNIERIVPLAP